MRTLGITTPEQLRQVDHRAVIAWERIMREQEGAAASTVRPRLAALSSLFKHLVGHGSATRNPVVDVQRPSINREEGSTVAFSKAEARRLLDAPPTNTVAGLRDRAILSVGLQVGLRRAEIASLSVGDLQWQSNARNEAAASKAHFLDLCALLEVPPPHIDATGATYAFEKGVRKVAGGGGSADVWRRGCFGWEYKSRGGDLEKAHDQLLRYAGPLENLSF